MNVLVTGAGSRIGQAVIKLINKSEFKIKLVVADYFVDSVGFYWTKKKYILPNLLPLLKKDRCEKLWLNKIISIIKTEKLNLIIPGVDFELPLFSKYKSFLEKKFNLICLVSEPNQIKIFNDKFNTYKFFIKNKISFPNTSLYKNKSFFFKNNNFPIVIKPRVGHTSQGVKIIKNSFTLNQTIASKKNLVLQEFLIGNEYTCGAVIKNKKVLSLIILRRKLTNGNTSVAFNEFNINIANYINQIVINSDFFGPINFQLILTKLGPKLLEINPRFSGTSFTRYLFGLNEFDVVYSMIKDREYVINKLKSGMVIKYIEDEYISESQFNTLNGPFSFK